MFWLEPLSLKQAAPLAFPPEQPAMRTYSIEGSRTQNSTPKTGLLSQNLVESKPDFW